MLLLFGKGGDWGAWCRKDYAKITSKSIVFHQKGGACALCPPASATGGCMCVCVVCCVGGTTAWTLNSVAGPCSHAQGVWDAHPICFMPGLHDMGRDLGDA